MNQVFGVIAPHPPIMVPGVGGRQAAVTKASLDALEEAREALSTFAPDTLVLMSPHAPALSDAFAVDDSPRFAGDLAQFGDPTAYHWPGDPVLAAEILTSLSDEGIPGVARREVPRLSAGVLDHATIVPLSFLEPTGTVPIVVLSLAYLPYEMHRHMGEVVASAAQRRNRRVAFVASGDLSHRLTPQASAGYSPHGEHLDAAILNAVRTGEFSALSHIDPQIVESGGECGLRSFITLGGFVGAEPVPTRVLSYEGPWGVGYLTALVGDAAVRTLVSDGTRTERGSAGGMPGQAESPIVTLARQAIERYVRHGERLASAQLTEPDYPERAGAFVSLHRNGQLRGCIGTILPTRDTLALEVVGNAIEAATRDPRFPPMEASELDDLDIKVDVLHPPESCSLKDLDPERFGVIASSGWRRGLLLPSLEGVDDVESQIRVAMDKAGIQAGEPCSFERFRVDRYT